MSFEVPGATALDHDPCYYAGSRLLVRGPERALDDPYVAVLGSSDTYGKFVTDPFAALLETEIEQTCVNLGCVNAGVDALLQDQGVLHIARGATVTVLQIMGAQNLSNRYYQVHPRRNDRFLEATALLRALYDEVDFTEYHFNKHLLTSLAALSPERFQTIRADLQSAWVARMRLLLAELGPRTLLLWVRHATDEPDTDTGRDPLLVRRDMVEDIVAETLGLVEIEVPQAGLSGELRDMCFGPLQAPAAEQAIGPDSHARIARALADALAEHI